MRAGGVALHAEWAIFPGITRGRRRVRSGLRARWRIQPAGFWCNYASSSTVKSSIPLMPQRPRPSDVPLCVMMGWR
jgi:hypothetical protein